MDRRRKHDLGLAFDDSHNRNNRLFDRVVAKAHGRDLIRIELALAWCLDLRREVELGIRRSSYGLGEAVPLKNSWYLGQLQTAILRPTSSPTLLSIGM